VAELESFSLAARELAVSQPALSRTIQQVEAEIGARLFDRTTRNVTLTPAGAELRPIASRLVAEFEGAFGELALFVVGRRGRVVVAALPSVAAVLLPPAIVGFQADFPDVEVSIQDGLSGSVLDAVREGRADIGITMGPSPSDTLAYTPLLSDEFGLVCRQDSPLAAKQVAPWSIFSEHRFIAMSPASSVRQMTDAAFLQAGVAVRPLYGCSFLGTAGHLVAVEIQGHDMNLVARTHDANIAYLVLDPALTQDIAADEGRIALLHGLLKMAALMAIRLEAKGINTQQDILALAGMGIHCLTGPAISGA